jgi:G6PDH family F420-dependent oxidoreductase
MVWAMIGAIAQATSLPITTAVTCPTGRQSPLLVAQAAATSAVLNPGFRLGVGSGEALNEHATGEPWPSFEVRLEKLVEAVALIRDLWTGEVVHHRGTHFTVDGARIYTLPEQAPEIWVSGFGEKATRTAAEIGDGYISTSSEPDLLQTFRRESGGKLAAAGMKVAYAQTEDEGVEHAHRLWSTAGLPGELAQVLPSPQHFEQASSLVTKESTRASVTAGSSVDAHLKAVNEYIKAGYDEIYIANMGPHYLEMIEFYGERVLPALRQS